MRRHADDAGGNVFTIPRSGGTLTPIATGQSSPYFPVSNGSAICWIDAIACAGVSDADVCVAGQGEGAIVCASPNAAPVTIAESSSLYLPTGMLFDGANFFVTTGEDASFDGPLTRVPAAGGAPTVIAQADGVAPFSAPSPAGSTPARGRREGARSAASRTDLAARIRRSPTSPPS